jgi:hypothetical protein
VDVVSALISSNTGRFFRSTRQSPCPPHEGVWGRRNPLVLKPGIIWGRVAILSSGVEPLQPTECKYVGGGSRYSEDLLRRRRSSSWATNPTTIPRLSSPYPSHAPGPVHAVSSHFCATPCNVVSQTRLKYSEQARWVMREMNWKVVSGGFLTGTTIPELVTALPFIYRLYEAQVILCHSQSQHYLICINSRHWRKWLFFFTHIIMQANLSICKTRKQIWGWAKRFNCMHYWARRLLKVNGQIHTTDFLFEAEEHSVPIEGKVGCFPESVWRFASAGNRTTMPRSSRFYSNNCTAWATSAVCDGEKGWQCIKFSLRTFL